MKTWIWTILMLCAIGCGDSGSSGDPTADTTSPDDTLVQDTATADGTVADTTSPDDTATDSIEPTDSVTPQDVPTPPEDAVAQDTTPEDTAPEDTAPEDTAPEDIDPSGDKDDDGVLDKDDNCADTPNTDQADFDQDGMGDVCDPDDDNDHGSDSSDQFPYDPTEWSDIDNDGTGDNADTDDDNDGLDDEEEATFGTDCAITNPLDADTDVDGVPDSADAYPNDPFPAFITMENTKGSIEVVLSDGAGGFAAPFQVGQDLGNLCSAPDTNCKTPCGVGTYCSVGVCEPEDATKCAEPCATGQACRQRLYSKISIADFDGDGKMDFLANTYPAETDGTYQVWFFKRLSAEGAFPQQFLGYVNRMLRGPVADVNGDFLFDIVRYTVNKPAYIADVTGVTFLGNGIMDSTNCVVGNSAADGCAFVRVADIFDITDVVDNQWGFPWAREAQDLTGDGYNDLVFGTYSSGGNSPTKVYLLPSNGDGTFAPPSLLFTHNATGSQSPTNSMMFADFTSDKVGDVVVGLDDDGDAGAAWLYQGTGSGAFSGDSTKVFDINTTCNSGCGDKVGRTGTAKAYDFDFDGNMDVILGYNYQVVSKPPSKLSIFFGKGNGLFDPETQVGLPWDGNEANRFQAPQRLCPWYQ